MSTAPDGTPIEVIRNAGKPTKAAEIAQRLASQRKRKEPKPMHADELHDLAAQIREENASAATTEVPAGPETSKGPAPVPSAEPATLTEEASIQPVSKPGVPPRPLDTRGMKPMHVVEAALFSAGKPIAVEEIVHETRLSPETVKKAIKELAKAYEERDTVLEVGKAGTKWAMQVRSRAAEPAARFAPMEIAPKLLKTLALIAYHQPMKQSELVEMIGTKVYDHVPELIERGLVKAREDGATKILHTTAQFPEYFGLDAASPEEVRQVMGKLVGIDAPPRPKDWKPGQKLADLANGPEPTEPAPT
ncbi:MAG: segregation and condensation protein [Thermoplasmata archaeon]|jgi:segregation and condensation protein B|nr:segregation and condensation protein [Thermoplasmata archaeon]